VIEGNISFTDYNGATYNRSNIFGPFLIYLKLWWIGLKDFTWFIDSQIRIIAHRTNFAICIKTSLYR